MSTQNPNRIQKAIKEAFIRLSLEKSVESISVTEVAEQAQINRTTFYHHYQDIFQLLNDCVCEGICIYKETAIEKDMQGKIDDALFRITSVLNFYSQYPNMALTVLKMYPSSPYLKEFHETMMRYQLIMIDALITDKSEFYVPREFLAHFCIGGISQMIMRWLENGLVESKKSMAEYLMHILLLTVCVNTGTDVPPQLIEEIASNRELNTISLSLMNSKSN